MAAPGLPKTPSLDVRHREINLARPDVHVTGSIVRLDCRADLRKALALGAGAPFSPTTEVRWLVHREDEALRAVPAQSNVVQTSRLANRIESTYYYARGSRVRVLYYSAQYRTNADREWKPLPAWYTVTVSNTESFQHFEEEPDLGSAAQFRIPSTHVPEGYPQRPLLHRKRGGSLRTCTTLAPVQGLSIGGALEA